MQLENQSHDSRPQGSRPDADTQKWRILEIDPWLGSYRQDIELRMERYQHIRQALIGKNGSLRDFANGHQYFGIHRTQTGWIYREWAPAADALFLMGDFNEWDRESHPLERKENGIWEIQLQGQEALRHESLVKVLVHSRGRQQERIPLYINKVVQDRRTHDFCGQVWVPPHPFIWSDRNFKVKHDKPLLIYETHIGMAQEKEGIGTYREFERHILARIKDQGYNTIQIMAVMEHPYYASFGYHVSNCFAPSSWFGNPDELKSLVNTAHEFELNVLMDIVQSHVVKNHSEGINEFDGTEYQFFHSGERGNHSAWDSKLFDYGKPEVIHFLLSSLKYWLETYHFDGFRFDGVTSMLYLDHGLGTSFDNYDKYFSMNTDLDAVAYLQLANELVHAIRPDAITIAEDMSGMPGICLPIDSGGIGFDYRLCMGIPDYWIRTLEKPDELWDLQQMWHELTTSRPQEKRVAYVESHDQALVGDKTLIFRMADQEMYWHMSKNSQNLVIDRALALHKMIRLVTISLGAEGYLNFMGNEFGHPEWIDFPREGNGWSYKYCRRQWSLADNNMLRYSDLNRFDRAMLDLVEKQNLAGVTPEQLWLDQEKKLLAFRVRALVFVFNFHPHDSMAAFALPLHETGQWQVVLDTDEPRFGGQGRICHDQIYPVVHLSEPDADGIILYSPCRTAMVLRKI